jgi:hypothetical protein
MVCITAIEVKAALAAQQPAPLPTPLTTAQLAALDPHPAPLPPTPDDGDPHHFNERTLGPRGPHTDN